MREADFADGISALSNAISRKLTDEGANTAYTMYEKAESIIDWLSFLVAFESTGKCDDFLDGLRASIIETIACGSIGLVRPAIFAMRAQVDILFSWLYFKDHAVEWTKVEDTGEGFVLKREVKEYLCKYVPQFEKKFSALLVKKTRKESDPYKVLSAHVHAQGSSVLPTHANFEALIGPKHKAAELVLLQGEVAEYLSDILLSCYGHKWATLPSSLTEPARSRLSKNDVSLVFG